MKRLIASLMLLASILSLVAIAPISASAAPKEGKLLKNVPVSGTLSDGGTFKGKLTITEFGYDSVKGLVVNGFLRGTVTTADGVAHEDFEQAFSSAEATVSNTAAASASEGSFGIMATCDILFLDVGPIFLDLLGLQVDLSEIVLDINAVSGAGNLLGNLLCAVVGLLDPGTGLLNFLSNLNALLDILNQINNLL